MDVLVRVQSGALSLFSVSGTPMGQMICLF